MEMVRDAASPVGVLWSQIGYDFREPVRVLVRGNADTLERIGATFQVFAGGAAVGACDTTYWGDIWGSHWWVADLSNRITETGLYSVVISDSAGAERFRTGVFEVAPDLLWRETHRFVGVEQAERRRRVARDNVGWFDAGMEWQEANSHAAYIGGFCDVLEFAGDRLDAGESARIETQIVNGADYLCLLQDKAAALPGGGGGVVHQAWKFDTIILPADVGKAAWAWARTARCLPPAHMAKSADYRARAVRAMAYLRDVAKPLGADGFAPVNHGVADDFVVPEEYMTRDLMMQMGAAFELAELGEPGFRDEAAEIAAQILKRQIGGQEPRDGLYGHFRNFEGADYSEKSWTHNMTGADCGGFFPHYVLPLLRMRETWRDHSDAGIWEQAVRDFAYGYFLPACSANPFLLLPLGQFENEGLLWFAGSWHGMNAAYGYAAVLAREFARFFDDAAFLPVATGNLQWIAGLNAGLNTEAVFGCHLSTPSDTEPGRAKPVSMINGIGASYAGCWLNIKGAITNGFSAGNQFRFDVAATRANDAPSSFTDEDWITHSAAWLSATARTCTIHHE